MSEFATQTGFEYFEVNTKTNFNLRETIMDIVNSQRNYVV